MSTNERPPITNRQADLDWMRLLTHKLNQDLTLTGEFAHFFRHVLELIQLVEAQRDLLVALRSLSATERNPRKPS